jgi:hypothetical protein
LVSMIHEQPVYVSLQIFSMIGKIMSFGERNCDGWVSASRSSESEESAVDGLNQARGDELLF